MANQVPIICKDGAMQPMVPGDTINCSFLDDCGGGGGGGGIPDGGDEGQALRKLSSVDGDADWDTLWAVDPVTKGFISGPLPAQPSISPTPLFSATNVNTEGDADLAQRAVFDSNFNWRTTRDGTAPSTQSGYGNTQSGYGNAQTDTTYCSQSGKDNVQTGSLNIQSGSTNTQGGSYASQSGLLNVQTGANVSTQSGQGNTQSAVRSLQSGQANEQTGQNHTQSGFQNQQSGFYNSQSGYYNAQEGSYNLQAGSQCNQQGNFNVQGGQQNTQTTTVVSSAQFGSQNTQSGDYGFQHGVLLNDGGFATAMMFGISKTAIVGERLYMALNNGFWLKPVDDVPGGLEAGVFWFDNVTKKLKFYNGVATETVTSA